MALSTLSIQSLRNIQTQELVPGQYNIFYGDNGSGKTSVLEAINLLATGRSFRAHHQHVIQHGADCLYVRATIKTLKDAPEIKIALQKARNNQHIMKCGGQVVDSISEIARYLPVQALHLLNYQLLQTAPESRRKLLDWAVFHVKHSFLDQWRIFNQLLKQRNAALKHQLHPQAIWEQQLAQAGETIHQQRQQICQDWFDYAQPFISQILELPDITLNYYPGWDTTLSFEQALNQHFPRDLALGYTYQGPQRADLQIKYQGKLAQHVLSQGQQKRLVAALQLSQAGWVYQQATSPGILLIDDLPAELDVAAQQQIMQILLKLQAQVFLTCVDESTAHSFASTLNGKLFHVKHGHVSLL